MAHLLSAEKVGLDYPTRTVFDSLTCGIDEGDRVGIVGRNGDGKSSLLGILAGIVRPTSGNVTHRGDIRVGYLPQDDQLSESGQTVGHTVVGERPEYEWASDAKIRTIVQELVGDIDFERNVADLSGGERRRIALASLLVEDWDVLALDEPTNHLDLEAISWLAGHLKTRWAPNKGGLLLVTHDRWFLDEVVTTTWEVHDRILEPFKGGYAAYVLAAVERDRAATVIETKKRNMRRKELAWLRRGAPARTSKPMFHIEQANALIADVPEFRDPISLAKLAMTRLGKKVVDLENVSFSYDWEVLSHVTWRIAPGERTGILGANGVGKSTLLDLITGKLHPTKGTLTRGKTVRFGVLDQEYSHLVPVYDDFVRIVLGRLKNTFLVEGKEMSPSQLLERLGFSKDQLSTRVGELSGGQKRRLQLLLVLCDEPNVLILDEPTNDVDTDMLTALEDLLDTWAGTLIVVSHDRYFVERVTDQQYAIIGTHLRHLPGGVEEYLRVAQATIAARQLTAAPTQAKSASTPTEQLTAAEERTLRKKLASLESRIAKVGKRRDELHELLAQTDPSDWVRLHDLGSQIDETQEEQATLEDEWLALAEALDLSR
ncbi:MAG: ABC-F family ATP-binding cassette domain-containing protein [Propionibacteriaceae bacterium]|jgi:ATPase subunit of ABC transporter with duplicated ATPase domains|nr:ABC-F family ATP-binding cassette domain-containing protein [Propionibacteriaceae bacterium]